MTVVIVNMMTLSLMMLQVGGYWEKKETHRAFNQADLTGIQVVNKNIKGLNRRLSIGLKAINENKGIQRRPGSGRKSTISKSTFEIIKKCLEIDNGLSTFESSNKLFEEKWVKISNKAIRRYSKIFSFSKL